MQRLLVSTALVLLAAGPLAAEFGEVAGFGPSNLLDKVAADSASVVRAGLEGLANGKAVIIPGLMNKSTAQAHRFFPRSWVRKAAGMLKP